MTAPFRGLGLGIFLITVGMSLDLRFVLSAWRALLAALLAVLAVKAIVTAASASAGRSAGAVAAETGLLMASPSETTLIVLGRPLGGAADRRRDRSLLAGRDRARQQ